MTETQTPRYITPVEQGKKFVKLILYKDDEGLVKIIPYHIWKEHIYSDRSSKPHSIRVYGYGNTNYEHDSCIQIVENKPRRHYDPIYILT